MRRHRWWCRRCWWCWYAAMCLHINGKDVNDTILTKMYVSVCVCERRMPAERDNKYLDYQITRRANVPKSFQIKRRNQRFTADAGCHVPHNWCKCVHIHPPKTMANDGDGGDDDNVVDAIKFEAPKPSSETHSHFSRARFLLAASVIFDYLWLWHRCALLFYFLFFFSFRREKRERIVIKFKVLPVGFLSAILFSQRETRALFSFSLCSCFIPKVRHFALKIFRFSGRASLHFGRSLSVAEDEMGTENARG